MPTTERSTFWLTTNPYADVFDHLAHVIHYPYGCIEQTTSSTRPLLYLPDLVASIDPSLIADKKVADMVLAGIRRVFSMQTPAGGFAFWPGGTTPYPWGTAYATHMLLDAQKLGHAVPQQRLDEVLRYIEDELTHKYEIGRTDSYILEPRPRSIGAKLIQTFRALQLELRLSKDQILAAYLRFLPFGQNIEGIEAASLTYFGHRSQALSTAEIATLLAVPQDPRHRFPSPEHAPRLQAARNQIAQRLLQLRALPTGCASPSTVLAEIRATAAPALLRPLPREALHLAQWLRTQAPGQLRIRTTLDRAVQRQCESIVRAAQAEAARRGIYNAAVVVIDNQSAELRAAVGNFDFWDSAHHGQVVGFTARRSPGSALKPLLYALSIDQGIALPGFLLPDVPLDYSGYAPRNFEKDYRGLVRLDESLWLSLNLPFVHLLGRYGVERFIGNLTELGVRELRRQPGHYGLSAIIGGLELSPLELAAIYVTLGRDGRYQPLRFLHEQRAVADSRIFGPGAAYLTRQALRHKDRPDCPSRQRLSGVTPAIAWKTGTSFGYRDAWAAGLGARYTAVVWVGNFDGTDSAALVGLEAAGPLLFDLLDALGDAKYSGAEPIPDELHPVEVCAYSGYPVGPACPQHHTALGSVRSVPTARCPYHIQAEVDAQSGLLVALDCRSRYKTEPRTFPITHRPPHPPPGFQTPRHRWVAGTPADHRCPHPVHKARAAAAADRASHLRGYRTRGRTKGARRPDKQQAWSCCTSARRSA